MIVLDSSVASYIFNKDDRAQYYLDIVRGKRVVISFQTLEELWFGAYKAKWGERRRNELSLYLQQFAVIWPNLEMVEICGRLRCERESSGTRLQTADAWIAATAILLACPLASHDRDFSGISGLEVITAS